MRYFALSGRPVSEITIDSAVNEELTAADLRIHPDTLRHQAGVAENDGNAQLADNFRRAAELASVEDADLLSIYEALRPGRSTYAQLEVIASDQQDDLLVLCRLMLDIQAVQEKLSRERWRLSVCR